MSRLLLAVLLLSSLPSLSYSAGRCDLSSPPISWLTTTALGISKWATAGVSSDGNEFCVTGNASTIVEVDYHIDLSDGSKRLEQFRRHGRQSWDNPDNMCVMDDPTIHVCIPFCSPEIQPMVIEAVLASGNPQTVASSIEDNFNQTNWAITVLQVDFLNPLAHLNVSIFADPAVWCSVYIGIDPKLGFPYLFEVQLAKVIQS